MSVSVSTNVSIRLKKEEKDTLEKAKTILETIRHDLFVNDADDSEEFWACEGAIDSIKDILSICSVKKEGVSNGNSDE